ncbi:MAG: thioredoxin [Kiritimatiellae bacterium]|nr:thioredoxin [Kiritimatiellia bacterium]
MTTLLNNDNFDSETSTGVVLIDFFAEWCGPCHEMAPVIDSLATDYAGRAKVCKVDVDKAQQLAVRFGIQSIPTLFVLKDGKLAGQFVGITAKAKIAAAIDQALV